MSSPQYLRRATALSELVVAEENDRRRALLYYSFAICPEVSMVLAGCDTSAAESTPRRRPLWRTRR